MCGLDNLHPFHHITTTIRIITDVSRTLPSAKTVYDGLMVSPGAANAVFVIIEHAVSEFIREMVASEENVLFAQIDLLQGYRVAAFMGATGFIRDNGRVGSATLRTGALTDRFVVVVSAIAFSRYLKTVLGRVVDLYVSTSKEETKEQMWQALAKVWEIGCNTLARALVRHRSDVCISTGTDKALTDFRAL